MSTLLSQMIATRNRSIDYCTIGSMYLPNPDPVLKAQGRDISIYQDLLIDDRVCGSLSNRFNATLAMDWEIDRNSTVKRRQSRIVSDIFNNLPLNRIIESILSCRCFGYAVLEVMWGVRDGFTVPVDIVAKPQRWFVFDQDNELRLRTKEDMILGELLPKYKFLSPTSEGSYDNPYGIGLLSRCFWPVVFKKGGWRFWVQFSEKYGQVWPVGKLPRSAATADQKEMLETLESMVRDGAAVIPDDGSIDFKESATKGATSDLFRGIIAEANNAISTIWLGHAGAGESVSGSLGGKDVSFDVRHDLRNADKSLVEETLNQLIMWICEINWGSKTDIPKFCLWEEDDVDIDQASRDKTLSEAMSLSGLALTREYYLKQYGLDDTDVVIQNTPLPRSSVATQNTPLPRWSVATQNTPLRGFAETSNGVTTINHLHNRFCTETQKPMDEWIDKLRDMFADSADMLEMKRNIETAFPDLPVEEMARIIAEESIRANIAGRLDVASKGKP